MVRRFGYGRKRRYPPRKKFKRTLYAKPSARTNRNNLYTLSKQVSALSSKVKARAVTCTFARSIVANPMAYPGRTIALTVPNQFQPIFSVPGTFDDKRKWFSRKINIDMTFNVAQEAQLCQYTIFIVSLKPPSANTILQAAGEDLSGLTADVHYRMQGGKAFLNLNYFNLHYTKRLSLLAEDTLANTTITTANKSDVVQRIYCKIPFRRLISPGVAPSAFNQMPSTSMPDNTKLYLIIFTDDMAGAVNTVSGNVLWTLSTV